MKILVACSSSNEIPEKYKIDCEKYLEKFFSNGDDLVFGASSDGLMGIAYKEAMKHGGSITGIVPNFYKDNLKHLNCTEAIVTNKVSERTDYMAKEADVILFLPGGIGTVYELFGVIEMKRSGEFDKPIIIYNSCGYYDELLLFIEKLYNEKFTSIKVEESYFTSNSIEDTIDYLENYLSIKKKI